MVALSAVLALGAAAFVAWPAVLSVGTLLVRHSPGADDGVVPATAPGPGPRPVAPGDGQLAGRSGAGAVSAAEQAEEGSAAEEGRAAEHGSDAEDGSDAEEGTDPVVGTLQALVDGRAEAWSSGDPSVLRRFLAPGSPALDSETASLARADEEDLRYPAVAFRVEQADVVEEAGERLTVDALVARDPLRGVGAEGEVLVEEPASTERVRFVLTRSETGEAWRLWSWAPG